MSESDKKKKHDRQKRGLKVFFFPRAHGQKHKHKKNKYYVSHDDRSRTGSIMSSGDSPAHHNRTVEAFDFNPDRIDPPKPYLLEAKSLPQEAGGGRGSPVATTSRDVAVQSGKGEDKAKGEVQASVLVEPGGGRDKDKEEEGEEKFFGSPTLNNEEEDRNRDKDDERRLRDNGDGGYGGKDRRKDDKFRKNGNIDKLDGVWIPKDKKPQNESEDDNCIVKCLYVTMTCCECSIM